MIRPSHALPLLLLAGLPLVARAQSRAEGWFFAADHEAKVLYLSEVQHLHPGDHWQKTSYVDGFAEAMGWANRDRGKWWATLTLVERDPRFRPTQLAKRERLIEGYRRRGYTVKPIALPRPVVVRPRGARGSRQ